MTRQRITYLFERYVAETITDIEKEEFFHAIAKADNDPDLKHLIDELWLLTKEDHQLEDTEHIFQKMTLSTDNKVTRVKRPFLRIAASISVLVILGTALYFVARPTSKEEIASEESIPSKPGNSFIHLPDGSTVVLNAGSFLHYPKSFEGSTSRTVRLEGEGFFDIKHDPAHPFIVISKNVVTTVLGTAFNVRAFPNDNEITVTVARGKVEVSSDRKLIGVLTRDQQMIIKNGVTTKDNAVSIRKATAWMESDIVFDDITLIEAITELEHRFNVEINLVDKDAYDCRFTGTFLRGENIEQILLVICEFNHVSMKQNSQTGVYEINGAGCK